MSDTLRAKLNRLQTAGAVAAALGLIGCAVGAFQNPPQFFQSWLFGCVSWIDLSLGCFVIAMIYYLTGGRWGDITRRFLEAGYLTLPLMGIVMLPLLFGLKHLYPWAQPAIVAADPILQHRHAYANLMMFVIRYVGAFIIWTVMALVLRRNSLAQDQTTDVAPTRRLRTLSGPGVVIYTFTTSIVFLDWVMSVEPDWYSTMFLLIICIGQILAGFAFMIILIVWFKDDAPIAQWLKPIHFKQFGTLLMAFVMFWTYINFGQFLIIWSGNLPREIVWYLHRIAGGWKAVLALVLLGNFFVPFFFLLFRASKNHVGILLTLAALVFLAQIANNFWMIAPAFHPAGFHASWLDAAALIGIGGLWLAAFAAIVKSRPLLAKNDPRSELTPAHV